MFRVFFLGFGMVSAFTHYLVPKIEKIGEKELAGLLETMKCGKEGLPLINFSDAGLKGLDVSVGDVVKVSRNGKQEVYYRLVVED